MNFVESRVARFFLVQHTQTGKIHQVTKIYQMGITFVGIANGHLIYQHLSLQGPSKITQIGIFLFENTPSGNPWSSLATI
jgi:hypothetical protein